MCSDVFFELGAKLNISYYIGGGYGGIPPPTSSQRVGQGARLLILKCKFTYLYTVPQQLMKEDSVSHLCLKTSKTSLPHT